MTTVDRRHLETLCAIADVGSITAAALLLNSSQSALSRTLSQLETNVGIRLVDRSTHHLELTPSGVRFVERARRVLGELHAAVEEARMSEAPIRFGYTWATNDLVASIIGAWERNGGNDHVVARFTEATHDALSNHEFDVVLTRESPGRNERSAIVATEKRWAALNQRHRLARRRSVRLADLVRDPIVLSENGTARLDLWPTDERPANSVMTSSTEEWLVEIAAGHGVGVTVDSIARSRPHPQVAYVPLSDAPEVGIRIVTLRTPTHPHARRFFNAALRSVGSTK